MTDADRPSISHAQLLEWLQSLDDFAFEHFVADLWQEMGYETEVEQQSGDAGVDVRATRDGPLNEKVLIQAKRYSMSTTVGGPEVQQYAALRQQEDNVDSVVVVTTSKFTGPAEERAAELNVKTINGKELLELIKEHSAYDLVERYVDIPEKPGEEEAETLSPDPNDPKVYGGYDMSNVDTSWSSGSNTDNGSGKDQKSNTSRKSKRSPSSSPNRPVSSVYEGQETWGEESQSTNLLQTVWDIRTLTGAVVSGLSVLFVNEALTTAPEATGGSADPIGILILITYLLAGLAYPAMQFYDEEARSLLTFGAFIAIFVVTSMTSHQVIIASIYALYGLMPILSGIYSFR